MDYGDGFDVGLPCDGDGGDDEVKALVYFTLKNLLN